MEDLIISKFKELIDNNKQSFFDELAKQFYQHIEKETKYELSHEDDPYWDHSGELIEVGTFNINDYDELEDFFEEYTGTKMASHQSGRGWNFEDYEDIYYFEIISDYVREILEDTINFFDDIENEQFINFLNINSLEKEDLTYDYFDELINDKSIELYDEIKELKAKEIYNRGLELTKK